MQTRTQEILRAVITEYAKTGTPISSAELFKKYGFDAKPATIRAELNRLSEGGYLKQAHTSGGRIPTDKGYRFFINHISENIPRENHKQNNTLRALEEVFLKQSYDDFFDNFTRVFHVAGVGYDIHGEVYKSSLQSFFDLLVQEEDITDLSMAQEIIGDFEAMDERMHLLMETLANSRSEGPEVFIGKSPITKSPHLSVIADEFPIAGKKFILAMIGPKRMDYEGNIQFFIHFKNIFHGQS